MNNSIRDLAVGQVVAVEELACGFSLARAGTGQTRHTIQSIEPEFITLEAESTGTKLRIPTYLIKEVGSVGVRDTEAA